MRTLVQDLKYSIRVHAKSPVFTLIVVLTLALGIGASTAVFSVVNAILLKPLPYPAADRIAILWRVYPIDAGIAEHFPWSLREIRAFFDGHPKSFKEIGAFKSDSFNLTGRGEPVRLDGVRATPGFFATLGVTPILGRVFSLEEGEAGHEQVVVLSYALWLDRFGANPDIVGRTAEMNGAVYTVIGVMPPGFAFPRGDEVSGTIDLPRETQLWVPLQIPASPRGPSECGMVARLMPGVDFADAVAETRLIDKSMEAVIPSLKGAYSRAIPLPRQATGDTRRPLVLILCAVGVVLLIACSNVASLLLTRSLGRAREFALRGALGAGRARMIRQLLTESVVLSAFGGIAGVAFAAAAIHFLKLFAASGVPRLGETRLDWTVLAFTAGITLVTGLLIGLAPALGPMKKNLVEAIKQGDQRSGAASAATSLTRSALLVAQVALALVLTISAGLLVRTFYQMLSADAGFKTEHVLTFQLSLPVLKYPDIASMTRLYTRAIERIRSLPEVQGAGIVTTVPFGGETDSSVIRIPGLVTGDKADPYANWTFASPGYFSTVETPFLSGRDFLETDTLNAPPVAIINATLAKKFFPGQDAVGKQISVKSPAWPLKTIVGVVADTKRASLREITAPEIYVPYTQNAQEIWPPMRNLQVALRTKDDPKVAVAGLRAAMRQVDPDLPLSKMSTLAGLVDNSMSTPRFSMLLVASFGILAVLLACIGMYGAISYAVAQRTREIATRIVLGAERRTIFAMILGQGTRVAAIGIAIGIVAASGATRLLAGFLYGVQAGDPITFAAVSLLLAAVALLACYLPARRAMSVDPANALRHE